MDIVIEQINSVGKTFVEFAWPMLWQSSVLIAILLVLDFMLRRKVRAVFRYWLWMLVLAKLFLPTTLSSPVSIGLLTGNALPAINIAATEQPVGGDIPNVLPYSPRTVETAEPIAALHTEAPIQHQAVTPAVSLTRQGGVFMAWVMIVCAMILLLGQRAMFVCGLVRQAKEVNDLMKDMLGFCCKMMGVKGRIGLKVSPNATSPAVCGLLRPVILLPNGLGSNIGASQLRVVLIHELAHIKRGDLWVNLLQTVLQIVYFYNPLLWLANWVIRRVREQAVDEAVQVALGERACQYPETLLNVARLAFERPALSLRLIGVVESKGALTGRIKRMLTRPIPKTAKLGIIGSLVIALLAVVLLPMAKAKDNNSTNDYASVTVREGVGFDGFVVGDANCTGEFIKSKFGKPDDENDWGQQGLRIVYHKKYGLDFLLNQRDYPNIPKNTLFEIRLNKGFEGKLSSGISMSSKKDDVFGVYGKPIFKKSSADLSTGGSYYEDKVLYYAEWLNPNGVSKMYYKNKGLLFWFDGDRINQIVVYPPGGNDTGAKTDVQARQPINFEITSRKFQNGDSITITDLSGPAGAIRPGQTYIVSGRYTLKTHDDALLYVYATNGEVQSSQGPSIKQGEGQFTRTFTLLKEGDLHLSFYPVGGGNSFGGVYFAQREADAVQKTGAEVVDVAVENFNISPYPEGGLYTVTVSIRNRGGAESPKFGVNFYRGDPNEVKPMTHEAGPIKPGDVWNEGSMPFALKEGTNNISVVLDPANKITESNEMNNEASMTIVVKDGKIVKKKVSLSSAQAAEFPEKEDLSTPEAAYASINRISARGDLAGWQRVSVKEIAEKLARENKNGKMDVEPEWTKVLLNAKIIEVRICENNVALAAAKLPQEFSSKEIKKPIDIRYLKLEDGK